MDPLTLKPIHRQVYQLHSEQSHPRLSIRRVLWVKFCRWLDRESPRAILRTLLRFLTALLLLLLVMAPQFLLGMLTSAMWHGYRIPFFLALWWLTCNAKRLWLGLKRWLIRSKHPNQYTFESVPVGELASFLIREGAFKFEDATRKLGLSQGQYSRIARKLEDAGVLCKDPQQGNARVLREISLENLIRQLRDGFPLVWSEEGQCWAERNGAFEQWCLSHDFKRRKLQEEIERKERKVERLEKRIEEAKQSPVYQSLFGH